MSTKELRERLRRYRADWAKAANGDERTSTNANIVALITTMAEEIIAIKEDVYQGWEPLERLPRQAGVEDALYPRTDGERQANAEKQYEAAAYQNRSMK